MARFLSFVLLLAIGRLASADVALAPLPGGAAVMVWSDQTGLHAQRVDGTGRATGEPAVLLPCLPTADGFSAVPTPTGAASVFGGNGRLWLRRLGPDAGPTSAAQRVWLSVPRPVTAASVGGRIGMLGRREAGPVVATPEQGAVAMLIGTAESPQVLLVRFEGLPVVGPVLPPLAGLGEAVLGSRAAELASLAASGDGAFLTRIGLDGAAIGNPVRLSEAGQAAASPAIAGLAEGWALAWTESGSTHIALVRVAGSAPTVTSLPAAGLPPLLALAAGDGGFAFLGRSGSDLVVVRFEASGRRRRPDVRVPSVFVEGGGARVAAVFDGPSLVVAIDGAPPRIVAIDARGRIAP